METFLKALLGTFVFAIVLLFVDLAASTSEYANGVVIDKHYKESNTRTSTGTVVTSKGGVGFVSSTSYEPEEFLLIVKLQNNKIVTANCEPDLYYKKTKNARIKLRFAKGYLTGSIWFTLGVE